MRIFIALDLDKQVLDAIERIQRQLRSRTGLDRGPVKWIRPERIHLTLQFLGEVRPEKLADICRIAEETARRHASFELRVAGLGTFGRPSRVLWAGVEPCPELMKLQADLEQNMEKAGWPGEKRAFSAHLTLCRIKDFSAGGELAAAIEEMPSPSFGECFADQLVVYDSQLQPSGPVYTAAARYRLQK